MQYQPLTLSELLYGLIPYNYQKQSCIAIVLLFWYMRHKRTYFCYLVSSFLVKDIVWGKLKYHVHFLFIISFVKILDNSCFGPFWADNIFRIFGAAVERDSFLMYINTI